MRLFIATPCAHEVVTSSYAATLFHLARNLGQSGIDAHFLLFSHSDLEVSRSILASMVLADPSFTHLLFIDSDMSFSASIIERMIVFDRPFVSAIYPRRSLDMTRIVTAARSAGDAADVERLVSSNADYVGSLAGTSQSGTLTLQVRDGFALAEHTGMGITLLQRRVLDTMVEKCIVARRADGGPEISPVPYYGFFHKIYAPDGRFWSEDISFCMRWTDQCGGEIWACVDQEIGHRGTYKFTGTYIDRLRAGRA